MNVASSSAPVSFPFTLASSGPIGVPEVLTQGNPNLDFTDAGTGSCTTNGAGHVYSAGDTCTVDVIFTPRAAGLRYGAVVLQSASGTPIATTYLQGTGSGSQISFSPAAQSTLLLSGLVSPYRMAVDAAGNLYIAQAASAYSASNAVVKETWNGSGYTQSTIATGLAYPVDVAVDGAGNVFIADQDATDIVEAIPSNGSYAQTIAFSHLGNVEAVAVDGAGNVFIASLAYGLLKETATSTGYLQSTISRNRYVSVIAVDGGGNLFVGLNGDALYKETFANGVYTESTIGFTVGNALSLDAAGNLYTNQPFGNSLLEYRPSGGTYTQTTLATLSNNARGSAVDASGNVFAIDSVGNVYKFDLADPPGLVFAQTAVGSVSTDSPKTVNVLNNGNAALNFTSPSTGTNPSITANFTLTSNGASSCPQLFAGSSSPSTLAAGASCTLSLSYTPAATTPLSGFLTLTDTALNAAAPTYAIQQIPLGVTGGQITPGIDWVAPAPILYGTPLSATQLDASSSVAGIKTYTPAVGTVLRAGTTTLSVTLAPTNTAQYASATATTTLLVNPVTPAISWTAPASLTYGTALSAAQLNASSVIPGTLSYTPAAGAVLAAGQHTLSVTLTPTDTTDYTSATLTTTITIAKATPVIIWPNLQPIPYGTALSSAQLNASASTPGSFVYSPAAGTVLGVGVQMLSVAFAPTDTTDFVSPLTSTVPLIVNKATLAVSASAAARVFSAANPAFAGTVTGAVNGDTFTESFSTPATAASGVGVYPIVPSVTGANLANYVVAPTNGALTITQAPTATTFALSNSNLTLTASVLPISGGLPTGTVGFYEGQTLVGTGTLTNNIASYTAATLPAGNTVITANYSGDSNFIQSTSPATAILTITPAQTALTVQTAGSVNDAMTIVAVSGFTGTLTFTCSGLPALATCSFSPATYTFSGTSNSTNVTMTVQTGASAQGGAPELFGRGGLTALAGVFGLLTIGGRRRKVPMQRLLTVLLLGGVCAGVTACGDHAATSQSPAGTSTVQVVASGASGFSQTTSVTLTVH